MPYLRGFRKSGILITDDRIQHRDVIFKVFWRKG